jgi:hypothetical protein
MLMMMLLLLLPGRLWLTVVVDDGRRRHCGCFSVNVFCVFWLHNSYVRLVLKHFFQLRRTTYACTEWLFCPYTVRTVAFCRKKCLFLPRHSYVLSVLERLFWLNHTYVCSVPIRTCIRTHVLYQVLQVHVQLQQISLKKTGRRCHNQCWQQQWRQNGAISTKVSLSTWFDLTFCSL